MKKKKENGFQLSRRDLLKLSGGVLVGSVASLRAIPAFADSASVCGGGGVIETYPASPLIGGYVDGNGVVRGAAFTDPLVIPKPLAPVPRSVVDTWRNPPGSGSGQQDSHGHQHQIWPAEYPLVYQVKVQLAPHSLTSLKALPIDHSGNPVVPPGRTSAGPRSLPLSTIYSFNGTFPGSMIYASYGQPSLVRFENHLDENPLSLDRGDFGDPEWRFLTHLHNGHTAPESDGNPNFDLHGYAPGEFCDNLYLNYPAGGDPREMQSFLWFHDHKEHHTGCNVYKGLVGLYPIFDARLDPGDETRGLRLPGVPNAETGRVDYDIPLAFYDCALDDGVTPHQDMHNGCGETHPEWWGKTFYRHFPNHGFVGDVFTVNGTAYPVLEVKRRKYRFRCLDASISRVYEFMLMTSSGGPQAAPGQQGQYQLPDGQQCMRFTQIASEGGLLPFPIVRNSFELWPAKRREVIVDFTRYMDGTPTTKGDAIYLVNIKEMDDGRKPDGGTFCVPVMKIVIGDDAPDNSVIPSELRALPPLPSPLELSRLPHRTFELERGGGFGEEAQWLINGMPFELSEQLAFPHKDSAEVWTIRNGGGGWVHPLHIHQEEHQVLSRNGIPTAAPPRSPSIANGAHADDMSKEDVVALDPGDEVVIYRQFRDFTGKYVAHCHNLAHEDHQMMFGWEIVP
jgi:FtsP/CotA-like multicopper oxidase with cupredoxin domain